MADEYTTVTAFAKRLGVSRKTFYQWRDEPSWPVSREPWWTEDDALEVEAWRAAMFAPPPNGAPPAPSEASVDDAGLTWREKKDKYMALKYQAQAAEAWGRVAEVNRIVADGMSIAVEIRQRMLLVPAALGTLAANKSRAEVERYADEQIRAALDDLADRLGDGGRDRAATDGDSEGASDAPAA